MKKNYIIYSLSLFIVFIIGFFAGQEYTKYKIATMVGQAFSGISTNTNEKTTEEKVKELTVISKGDNYVFGDTEDKKVSIKVMNITDHGSKYEQGYSTIEGNNNIIQIRLESENVGKKQAFKSLSEYDIVLITSDGMEFGAEETKQVNNDTKPEGYGGCISCNSNPGEKNVEDIFFDISPEKINGAKILLDEDDQVLFAL